MHDDTAKKPVPGSTVFYIGIWIAIALVILVPLGWELFLYIQHAIWVQQHCTMVLGTQVCR